MKKIISTAVFLFSIFCVLSFSPVLAAPSSNSQEALDQLNAAAGASGANIAGTSPRDPRVIAAQLIRTVLGIIGIIFVILAVYAGFLWMTAGGEEEKISKAKKLLYDGVIGLAVILSAYAITTFIIVKLTDATTGGNQYVDGSSLPPPTP